MLADQVGLGKTLQLAMVAQLMALADDGPVLVLAPKPLLRQWQDEMDTLLGLPSAVWNGRGWVDEHGIEHPGAGAESIRRCPRRVGIVSTGLVTGNAEAAYTPGNLVDTLRPPGRAGDPDLAAGRTCGRRVRRPSPSRRVVAGKLEPGSRRVRPGIR